MHLPPRVRTKTILSSDANVAPDIDVVGTLVTVNPGTFTLAGKTYTLGEGLTYTYSPSTYGGSLFVYVVLDQQGNPSILYDWVDAGPSGTIYQFVPGGPYGLVCNCMILDVAANATDLTASRGMYIVLEIPKNG